MTVLWGGLKNIRLGGQKTRKIEKVTGSQDDGFVRGSRNIRFVVRKHGRSKKSQALPMTRSDGLVRNNPTQAKRRLEWATHFLGSRDLADLQVSGALSFAPATGRGTAGPSGVEGPTVFLAN